jgi:hypothetical protein
VWYERGSLIGAAASHRPAEPVALAALHAATRSADVMRLDAGTILLMSLLSV